MEFLEKENGDFWRERGESWKHIFDSVNQNSVPRTQLFLETVLRHTLVHKAGEGREREREKESAQ